MASKAKITWHGDKLNRKLNAAVGDAIEEGTNFLRDQCREAVSDPYPPASSPGESPHLRTGKGRSSILHAVNFRKLVGYVFVADTGKHMVYLEQGTRYILPRPWLKPTFDKTKKRIKSMVFDRLRKVFK